MLVVLVVLPARDVGAFFDPTGPAQLMYLAEILAEDLKRFQQLQSMIQQGHAQTDFLRWVNAGVDNVNGILATLPVKDDQVLGDLRDFQGALARVNTLYGVVPQSGDAPMEILHDETIAETLKLSNGVKDYAQAQEQNANRAFELADGMSPKGAERLTAATNAQILHTLTQLLRVDGELLKLQGEQFALANKQDKVSVEHFNKAGSDMTMSMDNFSGDFSLPRFE